MPDDDHGLAERSATDSHDPGSGQAGENDEVSRGSATANRQDSLSSSLEALSALLDATLERAKTDAPKLSARPYNRFDPAAGSIVVSGLGYGHVDLENKICEHTSELDHVSCRIVAAGLDALRQAGIPLVRRPAIDVQSNQTASRWSLPEPLRSETGVIFASPYPDYDLLVRSLEGYHGYQRALDQLVKLSRLRQRSDSLLSQQIDLMADKLREMASSRSDIPDPDMVLRAITAGHRRFAGFIGATGPGTHIDAGQASVSQGIAIAEDWIRTGRCRRAVIVFTTAVPGDRLARWMGFYQTSAIQTAYGEGEPHQVREETADTASIGTCALVVESEDALRERGMRGIVELLYSDTRLGTAANADGVLPASALSQLIAGIERRFGLQRQEMAGRMAFLADGLADAGENPTQELAALGDAFGDFADQIIITSTESFADGEPATGLAEVMAIKILQVGQVPPVPEYWSQDTGIKPLHFSNGGMYRPLYLLYLVGNPSDLFALILLRRIPGATSRLEDEFTYNGWLSEISGFEEAALDDSEGILHLMGESHTEQKPKGGGWRYGTGPTILAPVGDWTTDEQVEGAIAARPADDKEALGTSGKMAERGAADLAAGVEFDAIAFQTLLIVSEHTGYLIDELDPGTDFKTELNLSERERAELLIAICQQFAISGYATLKIADFPTIERLIAFVRSRRPDLMERPTVAAGEDEGSSATRAREAETPTTDPIHAAALHVIAEKTGYPVDMLEYSLDMDLIEDLGIDNAEQLEIFQALSEAFDLVPPQPQELGNYQTLALVVGYVQQHRSAVEASTGVGDRPGGEEQGSPGEIDEEEELAAGEVIVGETSPAEEVSEQPAGEPKQEDISRQVGAPTIIFAITETVMLIAAEQTGIPAHELDLTIDLDTGLGLDLMMKAEIVSSVLESFGIPQGDDVRLEEFSSLNDLIAYVQQSRPDLVDAATLPDEVAGESLAVESAAAESGDEVRPEVAQKPSEPAGEPAYLLRRPVPVQYPSLADCPDSGVTLAGKRIVVMFDRGGVGDVLVNRLRELGATALPLIATAPGDELEARLISWIADRTIEGVYWLPALDIAPRLNQMTLENWRELNRQRVKNLHRTMRTLYAYIDHPGSFLIAASRLGGLHSYGDAEVSAPLGGSVTGLLKAYKREREDVLVKAVDFSADHDAVEIASALISETLADSEILEVGYRGKDRYGISLVEETQADGDDGRALDQDTIYLVTGVAHRQTVEIISNLAVSGGTFYLLDLVGVPDPNDPRIALYRRDKKALREQLIEEIRAAVPDPNVTMVEKIVTAVEREELILQAIEAVQLAGGTAHYSCVDLLDPSEVSSILDKIHQEHAGIDVIVHGAGTSISRALSEKDPVQFNMVFDLKADGFFNLLKAAENIPVGAVVVLSETDARQGNWGQSDSGAADDLLRKVTNSLRWQRPGTRGLALCWLGSVGDGSTVEMPLSAVRNELAAGNLEGEVILSPGPGDVTTVLPVEDAGTSST